MNTGAKDVLYKIRYLFIPYLAIIIACLIIKLLYTREEIYFAVNALYSTWADKAAPFITDIGDGVTIIILSAVLAIFCTFRKAFLLITGYAISSIVAQILKYSFDMPRPRIFFERDLSRIHFVKGVYILAVHSFPSGHTVTAFSAAVVLTYLVKNKAWGVAFLLIAVLVGYSRMYLSQHFFEDVTVGSVVGVIVTVLWLSYIDRKEFLKAPRWNRGLIKSL